MIKAAFFDIDGTLLDHSDHGSVLPASTLESLTALHRKGIKVFIATGRAPFMLRDMKDVFPFDGRVMCNGQLVKLADGTAVRRASHDPETIRQLIPVVHKEGFSCMIIEEDESFPIAYSDHILEHYQWSGEPVPPLYDVKRLDEGHPVYQFNVYLPLKDADCVRALPNLEVTTSGGDLLDVIPAGGGKEVGIAAMAAHFGISREEIMVFGDGPNDIRMIRWAGIGVAMGNATAATKQAADYVTTHVGKDGVKNAFLHFGVLSEADFQ